MELRLKAEDTSHSVLGASSAHRWMNCPGSVNLAKKVSKSDQRRSGMAASLGHAAHTLAAHCLETGEDTWEHIGAVIETENGSKFTVDRDMSDAVQVHLDHCRAKIDQYTGGNHKPIPRIEWSLSTVMDYDGFGTTDFALEVLAERLIIVDYKHGEGIYVPADNEQTKYYGYLALENCDTGDDIEEVELWIVQPRIPTREGIVRHITMTADELREWFHNEVIPAMDATREPDAPLVIGDWCRFCPVRDFCPALKNEVMNMTTDVDPVALTGDELGFLLSRKEAIKGYFDSLESEAFRRKMRGEAVPGQKLVEKQTKRIFKDQIETEVNGETVTISLEEAAEKHFGDDAWNPKTLKTPSQMEKLMDGAEFVTRWAYKPNAGYTIAPLKDKRREVKRSPEEMFGDIETL